MRFFFAEQRKIYCFHFRWRSLAEAFHGRFPRVRHFKAFWCTLFNMLRKIRIRSSPIAYILRSCTFGCKPNPVLSTHSLCRITSIFSVLFLFYNNLILKLWIWKYTFLKYIHKNFSIYIHMYEQKKGKQNLNNGIYEKHITT